jgi:hypothetical protein
MARPMATRWRWPPESWRGIAAEQLLQAEDLGGRFTFSDHLAFGAFRSLSEKPMLSATVMCG